MTTFFEKPTKEKEPGYRCGSGNVPRILIIFHELLHYLHFLENPIQYVRDKTSLDKKYYTKKVNFLDREFRWRVSEEERTLIGREDNPDDISEFSIRFLENFPIRYSYQGKDQNFYEKASDIHNLFKNKEYLRTANFFPNYKIHFHFDHEKAETKFCKKKPLCINIGSINFRLPKHLLKKK